MVLTVNIVMQQIGVGDKTVYEVESSPLYLYGIFRPWWRFPLSECFLQSCRWNCKHLVQPSHISSHIEGFNVF